MKGGNQCFSNVYWWIDVSAHLASTMVTWVSHNKEKLCGFLLILFLYSPLSKAPLGFSFFQ